MSARCLIPAAGLGTRMRPVTRTVPKELLPIGTRPILQWCLTEALEAGFGEIGVVTRSEKGLLEEYLRQGIWREGIHESVRNAAEACRIELFHQERPLGVVDAVLAAGTWIEAARDGGGFAVFLPDNVRIAGPAPLTVVHLEEAVTANATIAACHRVGPEARFFFGDVGRIELETLVPAGERPVVAGIQERGDGTFRATPEGAWRLMPRYAVTRAWVDAAREVASKASLAGEEADDVDVHRRLVERGRLRAAPWEGTLVDAGNPAGYAWAHHLLHQASQRDRDAEDQGGPAADREATDFIQIET